MAIKKRGKLLLQLVIAYLASSAAAGYPGQGEMHQRWPQWGLDAAIHSRSPTNGREECRSLSLVT